MLPPSVAEVGARYANLQQGIVEDALALLATALQRGRSGPDQWRDAVQAIAERLLLAQVTAAGYADAYLNDVLDAQDAALEAEARVYPQGFADLDGAGGSWLQGLVFAPNSVREPGMGWWPRFEFVANSIVKSGIADAARSSVQTGMQARPAVRGYVRMLRGKSCARCAILAGRVYRRATAFRRHPRCDCIHVPAAENVASDWATDPQAYFRSLSVEDQDRIFTQPGAEAIRLGADVAQVVNARMDMSTVTVFGREVKVTTAGTTVRATFGAYEVLEDGTLRRRPDSDLTRVEGARYRSATEPRLLPEQIFQLSEEFGWDRAEVLRQLRRFAYVL